MGHDQDEALGLDGERLGLELRDDVTPPELGNVRWLTVGLLGQPGVALTLMDINGPPVFDSETQAQIRALVAKRAAGGSLLYRRLPGHLRRPEGSWC